MEYKAYTFPRLPIPFTMAMAADLLAVVRGKAFDTHTIVIANPVVFSERSLVEGYITDCMRATNLRTRMP